VSRIKLSTHYQQWSWRNEEPVAIFTHQRPALAWSHTWCFLGSVNPERVAVVGFHAALEQNVRPLFQLGTLKMTGARKSVEVAQAAYFHGARGEIFALVVAREVGWLERAQLAVLLDCGALVHGYVRQGEWSVPTNFRRESRLPDNLLVSMGSSGRSCRESRWLVVGLNDKLGLHSPLIVGVV
jgi:hypothetical protein